MFHLHWQPGVVNSALRGAERLLPSDGAIQSGSRPQGFNGADCETGHSLHWRSKLRPALGLWLVKRSSAVFSWGWPTCLALIRQPSVISNDTQEFRSQSCLISQSPRVRNTNMWLKAKKTSILPLHLGSPVRHREHSATDTVKSSLLSDWTEPALELNCVLLVKPPDTFPRELVLSFVPWKSVVQS